VDPFPEKWTFLSRLSKKGGPFYCGQQKKLTFFQKSGPFYHGQTKKVDIFTEKWTFLSWQTKKVDLFIEENKKVDFVIAAIQ